MGGNMEYVGKYDRPRPKVTCPECKGKDFFWHCAKSSTLANGMEYIYDWGDLVTCLHCKCMHSVQQIKAKLPAIIIARKQTHSGPKTSGSITVNVS